MEIPMVSGWIFHGSVPASILAMNIFLWNPMESLIKFKYQWKPQEKSQFKKTHGNPMNSNEKSPRKKMASGASWLISGLRTWTLASPLGSSSILRLPNSWMVSKGKSNYWLVVLTCFNHLENMKVSWDYYSQYIEKKMFQTTNQDNFFGVTPF